MVFAPRVDETSRTRKRLRIGYNSESFSVKSACVGINPLRGWNLLFVGRTRRMTQYTASGMRTRWNPANAGWWGADLISSEAAQRRFHPSSLGFHPAKQDFIKFVWFVGIASPLQAFFVFTRKIQIVHFIPLSFNLLGIVQLLIYWRDALILVIYYAIINSPKIRNLTSS